MKYVLLIYDDESIYGRMSDDERNAFMGEYFTYTQEIQSDGKWLAGHALHPTSASTSVRVREGDVLVTDGPFAETKEQLGGFYAVEAESLDEAIELARRIPSARIGTIEVRPIMEFD